MSKKNCHDRFLVNKLDRSQLEDQFFKLQEESTILKNHGRKQEERIKKMAIKLVRLANERKKLLATGDQNKRGLKDIELEEMIENQQQQIAVVCKENELLKRKLQQTSNHLRQSVKMKPEWKKDHLITKRGKFPNACGELDHSFKSDNQLLREKVASLEREISTLHSQNEKYKIEINRIGFEHESNVLKIKEQMTSSQKITLNDNIELIKMKRNIKEKEMAIDSLEERYKQMEHAYEKLRNHCEVLDKDCDIMRCQLAKAEARNTKLQIKASENSRFSNIESSERYIYLEKEIKILQKTNERLTKSALDNEQEKEWKELERKLRSQISLLEAAIKSDAVERNNLIDKMNNEQDYLLNLNQDCRKSRNEQQKIAQENMELREKLSIFSSFDDSLKMEDLKKAILVVRQKREEEQMKKKPDFIEDSEAPSYSELQQYLAETIQELNKTREMLVMQHKINKDFSIEVENSSSKIFDLKNDYEKKLESLGHLIDSKTAKIQKLEKQLKDVVYGTKQFPLKVNKQKDEEVEDETLNESDMALQRGENLFEISICKVLLNSEAIQAFDDKNVTLFVTYAFYDFQLVSTPILRGYNPCFNHTSQYVIKVDDLFLHYLQRASTVVELHRSIGVEHQTVACCKIKFNKLLDLSHGKMFGSAGLTGTNGCNYGTLDYWVRLRVPMQQAFRLYQERMKALGYMISNQSEEIVDDTNDNLLAGVDNLNKLIIHISLCNNVNAEEEGKQPSIYCVYKFYDFSDHDTCIIKSTNSPVFNDRQIYPVEVNDNLHLYLTTQKLVIYVFDDTDSEICNYLGKASIDLISLAYNKSIKAPYALHKKNGGENGFIEVEIKWQIEYKPPPNTCKLKSEKSLREPHEKPPVTPQRQLPSNNTTEEPILLKKLEDQDDELLKESSVSDPPEQEFSNDKKSIPVPAIRKKVKTEDLRNDNVASTPSQDEESEEEIIEEIEASEEVASASGCEDTYFENSIKTNRVHFEDEIPIKDDADDVMNANNDAINADDVTNDDDVVTNADDDVASAADNVTSPVNIFDQSSDGSCPPDDTEELKDIEESADDVINKMNDIKVAESSANDSDENLTYKREEKITEDSIKISINHLILDEDASVWKDDNIRQMFIEYDLAGSVEETPDSVAKPSNKGEKMMFNYQKDTKFGKDDGDRRRALSHMLKHNESLKLLLISDPLEDQEQDCEEIGSAKVDLSEIVRSGRGLFDEDVIVKDCEDNEVIGKINMSIETFNILKLLEEETA